MSTATQEFFSLMVRLGECERLTIAETKWFAEKRIGKRAEFAGRMLRFRECPILRTNLKGEGQLSRGDEIEIEINEREADQEGIGSYDIAAYLHLSLPPAVFNEIWVACATADGVARNLTIHFRNDGSQTFWVTRVELAEYMSATEASPGGRTRSYPIREHPVVVEMRDMQRRLAGSWRGFLIVAGFIVGISILIIIVGGLAVHPALKRAARNASSGFAMR